MSATLRVTRIVPVLLEIHRGRFEVVVDGKRVGSIEQRETLEESVEPGRHTLQVRTGRFSSQAMAFDAAEDESIDFECHGGRIWPILLASLVVPSLALKLHRE